MGVGGMGSKRELERRLAGLKDYGDPSVELEQYTTPAEIAAHIVHLANLHGDLAGDVVDLGSGTGILALAAAFHSPDRVIGIDRDPNAIAIAVDNEITVEPPTPVHWLRGDATRVPVCLDHSTVLMNPPFGAQTERAHADRAFLETASEIASVSYSVHNAGSESFIDAFTADAGGTVTHRFEADFALPHQYPFHTEDRETITTEIYRIAWD